eukprot:SAG31_NODE_28622_length_407_cov_1.159091_1_plen_68_part_01
MFDTRSFRISYAKQTGAAVFIRSPSTTKVDADRPLQGNRTVPIGHLFCHTPTLVVGCSEQSAAGHAVS